jgi:hypothetical protein
MLKWIYFFSFSASISLNLYLLNTDVLVSDTLDTEEADFQTQRLDQLSMTQSSLKKQITPKLNKKNSHEQAKHKKKAIKEKVGDDFEKKYMAAQEKWKENLSEFLTHELQLDPQMEHTYQKIKSQRADAISKYFDDKKDLNPDLTYLYTIEDGIALGKLDEHYYHKMQDHLGTETFQRYLRFRKQFNQKMLESEDGHFMVDF